MNEILQKRIEEAAREVSDVCAPCDYGDQFCSGCHRPYMYDSAKKMGEVILNNQWVSVEEALPEVDGHGYSKPVLVMDDTNELLVSTYSKIYDKWNVVGPVSYHRLVVTHWMPIPSLKGGEK